MYDIWSNIHYGYVGRAAGFDRQTLIDSAHFYEAGESDPGDDITMHLGVTLWDKYRDALKPEDLTREVLSSINEIDRLNHEDDQVEPWNPAPK